MKSKPLFVATLLTVCFGLTAVIATLYTLSSRWNSDGSESNDLVVLSQAGENHTAAQPNDSEPLFVSADPYVPQLNETGGASYHRTWLRMISAPTAGAAKTFDDPPAWNAELDAERFVCEIAPDLKLMLPSEEAYIDRPLVPVVSDLNGPFMALPVRWNSARMGATIAEGRQDPIPVIDIRTGKSAGEFHWQVPIRLSSVLSPDGKMLVGPYHARVFNEQSKDPLSYLYAWHVGDTEPKLKLHIPQYIHWYGFVGKSELAVLVVAPERTNPASSSTAENYDQLQFWDVLSGKQLASVDLPYQSFGVDYQWKNKDDSSQRVMQDRFAAVSPRGKYVATFGKDGLALISCKDRQLIGTVPLTILNRSLTEVRFSDDASKIHVVTNVGSNKTMITELDAKSGRRLAESEFDGSLFGRVTWIDQSAVLTRGSILSRSEKVVTALKEIWPLRINDKAPGLIYSTGKGGFEIRKAERAVIDELIQGPKSDVISDPPWMDLDTSSMKTLRRKQPDGWSAVSIAESSPSANFKDLPIPPNQMRPGGKSMGALIEAPGDERSDRILKWLQLDAQTGQPIAEPVPIRRWITKDPNSNIGPLPFSVSADDSKLAIVDPISPDQESTDQVLVFAADGRGLVRFKPFGDRADIGWLEFMDDGRLLVAGMRPVNDQMPEMKAGDRIGLDLRLFEISNQSVKVIYQLIGGGYSLPRMVFPDRKRIAIARTSSFDIVDVSTGECTHHLGAGSTGRVRYLSHSPDGKRMAALYTVGVGKSLIVIWDLASEEAKQAMINVAELTNVAWMGNEHLLVSETREARLYDMRLNAVTVHYTQKQESITNMFGDDRGMWLYDLAVEREFFNRKAVERKGAPLAWKLCLSREERMTSQAAYFAEDRRLVQLRSMPIALELSLRSKARGQTHGVNLVKELESHGFPIGSGGGTASVKTQVVGSGDMLTNESGKMKMAEALPMVEYVWEFKDAEGRVMWSGKTTGRFQYEASKYCRGVSDDPNGGRHTKYDFGSREVRQAVVDEILDAGIGLSVPEGIPFQVILSEGKYSNLSQPIYLSRPKDPL